MPEDAPNGKLKALGRLAGVFERLGVPTALLLVFVLGGGYTVWRTGIWLSDTIISPLVKQHIEFVDRTEKVMQVQSQILSDMSESMTQIKETNKEVVVLQREMTTVQRDVAKTLDVQNRLLERLSNQERRVEKALEEKK